LGHPPAGPAGAERPRPPGQGVPFSRVREHHRRFVIVRVIAIQSGAFDEEPIELLSGYQAKVLQTVKRARPADPEVVRDLDDIV